MLKISKARAWTHGCLEGWYLTVLAIMLNTLEN